MLGLGLLLPAWPSCCFADAEINEEADAGVKLLPACYFGPPLFEACDTANQPDLPRATSQPRHL
jgi:hypothetical protein